MKKVLIAVILLISFTSTAGETYDYTLTVYELATNKPIEGIQVILRTNKDEDVASGVTDSSGTVVFTELKLKMMYVALRDSDREYYCNINPTIDNPERKNIDDEVYLRWVEAIEERKLAQREQFHRESHPFIFENKPDCEGTEWGEAGFPGGEIALQYFISHYTIYPGESIEMGVQGRVYLSFVVEPNGELTHIEVERGISSELDHEAIMLLRYMPRWVAGTCDGVTIRTRCRLPINFSLN
ncbi:MAG: TonB family protein [Crocinitomicaceae bacterium]|nr:TonB family protein [Crocinitomicaceae bacterium]